jgi:hypothetical protein
MRLPSRRKLVGATLLPASALVVAGCADKFTGGGTIPSTDEVSGHQANFGFTYKITNFNDGSGQATGTYHDPYAPDYPNGGVALKFTGLLQGDTDPFNTCSEIFSGAVNGLKGVVSYTSQNKNYPGSGQALLKACDNGKPRNVPGDAIAINIMSGSSPFVGTGPYVGYENGDLLTGGNLTAH